MFTIIGGDGKEYGPVNTEQLRAWIAAGRANCSAKAAKSARNGFGFEASSTPRTNRVNPAS